MIDIINTGVLSLMVLLMIYIFIEIQRLKNVHAEITYYKSQN